MIVEYPTCKICGKWETDLSLDESRALMKEWYDESAECISCVGTNRDPLPWAEIMKVKRKPARRAELNIKVPWRKHIASMEKVIKNG